jgi:hypothetical protein
MSNVTLAIPEPSLVLLREARTLKNIATDEEALVDAIKLYHAIQSQKAKGNEVIIRDAFSLDDVIDKNGHVDF